MSRSRRTIIIQFSSTKLVDYIISSWVWTFTSKKLVIKVYLLIFILNIPTIIINIINLCKSESKMEKSKCKNVSLKNVLILRELIFVDELRGFQWDGWAFLVLYLTATFLFYTFKKHVVSMIVCWRSWYLIVNLFVSAGRYWTFPFVDPVYDSLFALFVVLLVLIDLIDIFMNTADECLFAMSHHLI